jgi:cytochrome c553
MARKSKHSRPDEAFEPYEEHAGVPMPVIWVAIALTIWGTAMLYDTGESVQESLQDRAEDSDVVAQSVPDEGTVLFGANCATCHQPDGRGLRDAVPPLAGSEIVAAGPDIVSRILLRGIDGPLTVAGQDFDGHMPSFASALNDAEIAELASYVTTRWADTTEATAQTSEKVASLRAEIGDRGSFGGGAELAMMISSLPDQPPMPARSSVQANDQAARDLVFTGRDQVWSCASCHGDLGQGDESTPRLAGLPGAYIAKQLQNFREGTRENESMQLVAQGLSDPEMTALGAYYTDLRVPSTARPVLSGDLKRGEQLALQGDWSIGVPACFTCHGPSGFGVAPNFPGLSAQHAPYLAAQLANWVGGQRHNDALGLMAQISEALSTQDRRAVADYLASLPPVPAGGASMARMETQDDQ